MNNSKMDLPGERSAGFYTLSDGRPKDHLFKVLVVGEYAVGKMSVILIKHPPPEMLKLSFLFAGKVS